MNKYIKSEYDNFTKTTSYFIIQPISQDKEEMIVSMFLAEKLEDNLQYYLGISMTNNFGRSDLTHDPVNILVDNSKLLTLDYSKTIRNGDYEFYIYKCSSDDIMTLCETLSIELRVYRYDYTHKDIDVSQVFQFGARVLVDATEDNSMYSEYLAQYYAQEQLIKQKQEEEERSLREKRELEAKRRKEIEKGRREERKKEREIEKKKEEEKGKRKEELREYGANLYQKIEGLYQKYGNHGGFGAGYSSMWKKAERERFVDIFCNDEATLIQRIRLLKEINEAIQLYENLIIDTHSQEVPDDKVIYYTKKGPYSGLEYTKGDVLETIEVFKYARDIQQGKVKTRAIIVSIILLILLILLISIL